MSIEYYLVERFVKYNFGGLDLALGTRPHATRNAYKHQMKGTQIKILVLGRQDY